MNNKKNNISALNTIHKEVQKILETVTFERNNFENRVKDLEFFLDNLNEGLVIFNDQRKVFFVNKIALNLYGYKSEKDFAEDRIQKIISRDLETGKVIPYSKWPSARILKGEVFNNSEIEIENKKNGRKWVESYSGKLVVDEKGEKYIIASVRDITDEYHKRKKAEEDLRNVNQRLENHISNSPLGIIEFDPEMKVIRWSKGAEKIFGWKATEVLGKAISEMNWVYKEDIDQVEKESATFRSGKVKQHLNINRNYKKDGTVIWCEWYNSAIYDSRKKLISVFSQVSDITERKKLEQQKDEFISIASHELKTPMTSIKAFAQLLEKRLSKRRDKNDIYFLQRINQQIDSLNKLVSDLLDVSKISAGKLQFNMSKFNLNTLVRRTAFDIEYSSGDHEIEIKGGAKEEVFGDKDRIQQVLVNLITNAVKYSPNGKKVIIKISSDKNKAKVSVADFGFGIPKKHQKKVFERFYRAGEKYANNISGIGMGLYISKEIIDRHSGLIWVDSNPGKGSVFSFTLPLNQQGS